MLRKNNKFIRWVTPLKAGNNGCYAPGSVLLRLSWRKGISYKQAPPKSKNHLPIAFIFNTLLKEGNNPWIGSSKAQLGKGIDST